MCITRRIIDKAERPSAGIYGRENRKKDLTHIGETRKNLKRNRDACNIKVFALV